VMLISQRLPRRPRDRHLAATVKVRLLKHARLQITAPSVEVKAGVVLLRGSVRTRRQRLLAAGLVVSVPGVLGVFNELKVESDVRHAVGRSASIRSSDEA